MWSYGRYDDEVGEVVVQVGVAQVIKIAANKPYNEIRKSKLRSYQTPHYCIK